MRPRLHRLGAFAAPAGHLGALGLKRLAEVRSQPWAKTKALNV